MKRLPILLIVFQLTTLLFSQQLTSYYVDSRILITGETRSQLITWAEDNNGFFLIDSSSHIVLKIPNTLIRDMKSILNDRALKILSYNMHTASLDQERSQVLASILSREEILSRNLSYLDDADLEGTLALEREVSSLIQELEYYKGRLRVIENQSEYATVHIYLTAPQPVSPGSKDSSFNWLSTIDFYRFIGKVFK